ncbi:hypothetical protein ACFQX8_25350 [Klenkia terrae]|uniref:hypothetical protein n=1 Tax=Klenkia terrae TaxID=1052259 RepID=UPI00361A5835
MDDERSVSILLTPEGKALHSQALEVSGEIIGALGMTISEFDHLKTELRTLTDRVTADGNTAHS